MANITGSIADAGRLIHLAKRRERQLEDLEKQRKKIQDETLGAVQDIGDKFKTHYDAIEQSLKSTTVGLVTLDEMRAKQETYVKIRENELSHKQVSTELKVQSDAEKRKNAEAQKRRVLSFDPEDEEDEEEDEEEKDEEYPTSSKEIEEPLYKRKKLGKDPTVDTSFLPDREREAEENRLREELRAEWASKQEKIKNEQINIAFSYWDGSGHRHDIKMNKGNTVAQFLQKAVELLRRDFNELKTVTGDSLMFVKEDLIIPHFYTFHDFIVTKAMGKTGPLFEFDAAGELRVRQDAVLDTAESHPAKVVLRQWYERNKHIYPASRWEPFDPNKKYDRTVEDLTTL